MWHFAHFVFQVLASQCLTALCASAGGEEGCTVAEQPEIDVLLNALLSPCFSVRDAALRVSLDHFILIFAEVSLCLSVLHFTGRVSITEQFRAFVPDCHRFLWINLVF